MKKILVALIIATLIIISCSKRENSTRVQEISQQESNIDRNRNVIQDFNKIKKDSILKRHRVIIEKILHSNSPVLEQRIINAGLRELSINQYLKIYSIDKNSKNAKETISMLDNCHIYNVDDFFILLPKTNKNLSNRVQPALLSSQTYWLESDLSACTHIIGDCFGQDMFCEATDNSADCGKVNLVIAIAYGGLSYSGGGFSIEGNKLYSSGGAIEWNSMEENMANMLRDCIEAEPTGFIQ